MLALERRLELTFRGLPPTLSLLVEARFPLLVIARQGTDRQWQFEKEQKMALQGALDQLLKLSDKPTVPAIVGILHKHLSRVRDIETIPPQDFGRFIGETAKTIYDDWEEFLLYADIPSRGAIDPQFIDKLASGE